MASIKICSAYLGAKEYIEPLKNEVGGILDIHGQLILSSAPAIEALWALNIWQNPIVLAIDSINDGAKKLKAVQCNW